MSESRTWRRGAFSFVVLAYIGWLGIINALMFLPALGWLPENILSAMGHFEFVSTGDTHNLIHELTFAFIVGTAALGLLFQLRKPMENVAGQLIAMIVWTAMALIALITNNWVPQPLFITFGGLTLLATILHPAGRGLFNWLSAVRVSKILLGLIVVAAVPLLAFAFTNFGVQTAGGETAGLFRHEIPAMHGGGAVANQGPSDDEAAHDDEHANQGHYRNMAAFSFIVILVGMLASLRPIGWRLAAWIAGGLAGLLGLASVILPAAESSLGLTWGLAAIVWGTVFIAAAELTRLRTSQ